MAPDLVFIYQSRGLFFIHGATYGARALIHPLETWFANPSTADLCIVGVTCE